MCACGAVGAVAAESQEQGAKLLQEYVYRALTGKSNGTDVTKYSGCVAGGALVHSEARQPRDLRATARLPACINPCVAAVW